MSSNLNARELLGVWQRESISIDGKAPYEDSNVLWLHAGDYFADIRWPRSGEGTGIIKTIQEVVRGSRFSVGPIAHTYEKAISCFHEHYLDMINGTSGV